MDSGDNAGYFGATGLWAIKGERLLISTDVGITWQERELPVDTGSTFPGWRFEARDAQHAWLVRYGPGFTGLSGSPDDVVRAR